MTSRTDASAHGGAGPAPVLMKGNEAMAEAAIQAGCDAYFGYPITPQAELLEWMARRMPEEGRVFVQAESEIGAINMALGAAATGARVLVSTSGPGFSLMAEGMSYMAGAELPVVVIDVMRGGPGLGSIGPSQSDYLQATRGHGHGDYRVPVLAPASIAEAVELVADAFSLAERYRTPTIILADGIIGQAMEPVVPTFRNPPRITSSWSTTGADGRPPRALHSLHLQPEELETHDRHLQAKYAAITEREVRWASEGLDGAELLIVAYGTAARVAQTAIERGRDSGLRVGLLRPITLWPFPVEALARAARQVRAVVVIELSAGQLAEDVRLAVGATKPVLVHGRMGGMVPTPGEVVDVLRSAWSAGVPFRGGHRNGGRRGMEDDPAATTPTPALTAEPGHAGSVGGPATHGSEPAVALLTSVPEPDPFSLLEEGAWRAAMGQAPPEPADEDDPLDILVHGQPEAVR